MKKGVLLITIAISSFITIGQKVQTRVNAYGHLDFVSVAQQDTLYSDFKFGEQEVFINAKFNHNFSFLSEVTLNYLSHGTFKLNIERLRLKYNYYKNHSFLLGKFHTPVNYWNDVYYHARLFFPTIDRPMMFGYWIPIHTLGIRLQGQNIGKYNFGYDLLIGSGLASEDLFEIFNENSITAAVHWKPIDGMRIGVTYYHTYMSDASAMAAHSHSNSDSHVENEYKGPLHFDLFSSSLAYFGEKWEFLDEVSFNRTNTDTLGVANNISNYLYCGRRFKERNVVFIANDLLMAAENDRHTYHQNRMKFILGYKYEYSENLNLKAQLEYDRNGHNHGNLGPRYALRIQMSYGI